VSQNKSGYHILRSPLYHRDKIVGQTVDRLMLPATRRQAVLSLAHDTSHVSAKRTQELIQPTFHWPTAGRDINTYCKTCEKCQQRKRITHFDRTPISPIKRASFAFQHWFMNTFQLSINLPFKFNQSLICVDSFSRWPTAFPLRKVTAASVCDCLVILFSYTNLPSIISSDNATSFCIELNKEFLKRFNISPLFIIPTHDSANGLSERMVQNLKNMICKMAVDHKDRWPSALVVTLGVTRNTV
jgi:hypothetical protein